MKTYDTYQEAKIAHPESDIYTDGAIFCTGRDAQGYLYWNKCNPADYCISVEKFLDDGHEFVDGDSFVGTSDHVITVRAGEHLAAVNNRSELDKSRYVLRAAALEADVMAQDNEAAEVRAIEEYKPKPKRTKTEYVQVTESIFDLKCEFESRKLFNKKSTGVYCQIVHVKHLACHLDSGNVYREVETEITEREAFIEALNELNDDYGMLSDEDVTGSLFEYIADSGRFKLVDGE